MHKYSSPVRVGLIGATGYAGQELIALLARHPHVAIVYALSSGTDSAPRPLPSFTRVWDGHVEPLDKARMGKHVDIVFLAVPESAAAELGQSLVESGVRVIDLSGAFRITDDAARSRWYPATKSLPSGAAYGLVEYYRD